MPTKQSTQISIMSSIFQTTPTNEPYNSPTPGQISIVAGRANADPNGMTDEYCKTMADCGFNAATAHLGDAYTKETLANCAKNGISLFLSNANLTKYTSSYIKPYKNLEGLGGWILSFNMLPYGIKQIIEKYKVNKEINEADDQKHPVFVGVSGDWNYDSDHEIIRSYPEYVEGIEYGFSPTFWPVFYFPDLTPLSGDSNEEEERQLMYYKTLQYFAYVSQFTNVPFWFSIRCQAFNSIYGLKGDIPNERLMRGLVFTALAYGSQGLYYWNYRQNGPSGNTTYSNAPVDINGNKTETWDIVKAINDEVKAFNDVFCGCEMLDCRHKSGRKNTQSLKPFENAMGPLIDITCSGYEVNVIVSHIWNNEKNYLVVVFNPFGSPFYGSDKPIIIRPVTLKFSEYWKVYRLQKQNAGYREVELVDYDYSHLPYQGDYLIFRWE